MKIRQIIFGLGLCLSVLCGCNDDLNLVGSSIQPDEDKIKVYTDTLQIQATTIQMDSVYAKTTMGLIGEMYDPLYGNLKSDYICQFYCPEDYQFSHTPIDGKIDSVEFRIVYSSWVGDSLASMNAEIYKVTTPLERDYYTNIDPKKFCDMKHLMGTQTYTAYDMSIPDSIREITNTNDPDYYYPHVTIRMDREFGQKFYDETINNPSTFKNQESFNNFLPGIYVTTSFGSGNILNVDNSSILIYYKYTAITESSTGEDSAYVAQGAERFNVTKEVIQLNRFKNTDMSHLLQPNDEYAFLKTPAGVYTRLTIPTKEIGPKIKDRFINNLPLNLKAMPQEDWQYALSAPSYLLILPEDSVKNFFEGGQIEDNITSFLSSTYDSSTRTYTIGNISNVLKKHLDNGNEDDLHLLVIPVLRITGQQPSYLGGGYYTISLSNYLAPSGVRIRKDKELMKIPVITSTYSDNK
jgi:hypothetical protein